MRPANILILAVQVPFTRGGAEVLVSRLRQELLNRGHEVDVVQLPFNALPRSSIANHMAWWRAMDFTSFAGRKVDLVIGTKFPAYLAEHPNKVLWLVHQHRQAYELYGTRFGDFTDSAEDEALRQLIVAADSKALNECRARFTISRNVTKRLERFLGIDSVALPPPPPLGAGYRQGEKGDYILSVGRLCSIKRVDLIIRALSAIEPQLKLKIVGGADEPAIADYLKSEVDKHHLWARVEFLGRVSDDKLLELYANCFSVYYAPHDEDYGFVTIEARASGKPVVTAKDSGMVLDYIKHEENGLIADAAEAGIAEAFNRLWQDDGLYRRLCYQEDPAKMTASWEEIVSKLTSTL